MSDVEFDDLSDEALQAFWRVLVTRFPQATAGDLSRERTARLRRAARDAVAEWIANNVPPRLPEPSLAAVKVGDRFRLIRPVDRFPDFVARMGATGTVLAVEGDLWAQMDEPIDGAETWDHQIYWNSVDEFLADVDLLP
jgi:hypothetical protein